MKYPILIFFCLCNILRTNAQTEQQEFRIIEVYINYDWSLVSTGFGVYWIAPPLAQGIDAGFQFYSNKRWSSTLGLSHRKTGTVEFNGFRNPSFGGGDPFVGPVHIKYLEIFIDVPLWMRYNVINNARFKLGLASGARLNFYHFKYFAAPNWDGEEVSRKSTDFNIGLDVGLAQSFKIYKDMSLISSQTVSNYFKGELNNVASFEARLGFSFMVN
ncbi:MAG: hypothetical protein ACI8ZN_001700 [Bacteroidia bacterium]